MGMENVRRALGWTNLVVAPLRTRRKTTKKYDLFISHAHADKKVFVTPLVRRLKREILVWYDDEILKGGDSILGVIGDGMRNSRHALVIFSKAFLRNRKGLRDHEYHVLLSRQIALKRQNLIIPVLYDVTSEDVSKYDKTLGDRYQLNYRKLGVKGLVREIVRVVRPQSPPPPEETVEFLDDNQD